MGTHKEGQFQTPDTTVPVSAPVCGGMRRSDLITPNPKLKLLDQVREVMRLKHYSLSTERCYCDWIRRYILGRSRNCSDMPTSVRP